MTEHTREWICRHENHNNEMKTPTQCEKESLCKDHIFRENRAMYVEPYYSTPRCSNCKWMKHEMQGQVSPVNPPSKCL